MKQTIKNAFDELKADEELKMAVRKKVTDRMYHKSHCRGYLIRPSRWIVAMVCFVIFFISGLGGFGIYYTEAAAVSIDMNPSIEISINRFGRVVDTKSFDDISNGILKTVSLKHLSYEDAIEALLSSPSMEPYLTDGTIVSVTLETAGEDEQQWLKQLERCIDQVLSSHHSGVMAEYGCTTSSVRQKAHHQGMTMGKYCAIQEIIEDESGATMEEFQNMNMDEIKSHKNSCGHHN